MFPRIKFFLQLILFICFVSIVLLGQKKVEPIKPQIPQTQDFCFKVVKAGQGGCDVGEDIPYGTPLLEAIHQRDVNEIKRLISEGANVNEADKNGLTPILLVSRGDLELIDIFLKANADVSVEGKYGTTPLSASTICSKAVKKFLDAGADVNQKDINKKTALMYAAENKNIESIKILLGAGADIYDKDLSDMTPLLYALKSGSLEIVKFFFYIAEKKQLFNEDIATKSLLSAISNSQKETVEFLLMMGANPEGTGKKIGYPFSFAVQRDNLEIVKLLYKLGADIKVPKNFSPIYVAAIHGNIEIVKFLIENGADVNVKHNWTPLIEATRKNNIAVMGLLLKAGAKINERDYTGKTALMMACNWDGKIETVKFLLENGADVNIRDEDDNVTALSIAKANKKADTIKLLEDNRAID